MDRTQQFRAVLAKLVSDNMGAEAGRLFAKFYEYDDEVGLETGARSLLIEMLGPKMTDLAIDKAKAKL